VKKKEELTDNSCHVRFAICIDKLTKRLNLTKEYISNRINTYVVIEISFVVILELNNNLIGRRIQQDVTNDGRIDGVRLKEHDELGRKVSECETC
jgi:hypothetical protein